LGHCIKGKRKEQRPDDLPFHILPDFFFFKVIVLGALKEYLLSGVGFVYSLTEKTQQYSIKFAFIGINHSLLLHANQNRFLPACPVYCRFLRNAPRLFHEPGRYQYEQLSYLADGR
jgi:hypothetical protein